MYMYYILHHCICYYGEISKSCHKSEILKNHFHKHFHIPGRSADSICQEDMYFVMLWQAIW